MGEVTQVLHAIESGDPSASDKLLPLVYAELRALAERRIARESPGQTLQATALVHEAYMRLVDTPGSVELQWEGRAHFFGAAAEAMRRILIDRARAKGAVKRGGEMRRVPLSLEHGAENEPAELLELDVALTKLATVDPAKAELVKLRFFAGLTLRETAKVLGISIATADRQWAFARAWLYDEILRERRA